MLNMMRKTMRTNQVSLRVEIFDQEKPIQFSIYADSNNLGETLTRVFHALHERLREDMKIDNYEDFVKCLYNEPGAVHKEGVCEVYGDWFEAFRKIESDLQKNDNK